MRTPAKWLRAMKRRRPGCYWYRTMRHANPMRTEIGYVGKSRHLPRRDQCHHGLCSHKGCEPKPWIDLVVSRGTIQLPWWLGWDWITLSLETLLIWLMAPRYNWQKNPWPHKVGPAGQKAQRYARDRMGTGYRARVQVARVGHLVLRAAGVIVILTGIGGYLWTR